MKRNILPAARWRNTNHGVTKNPNPKILPCDSAGEPATFNAAVDAEAASAPERQDLAQLVWKYFEKEIRETLIEVQEAIQAEHNSSTGQISQRKQKRK